MRPNVRAFVQLVSEAHPHGPVVEFGSRQVEEQEHCADLRAFFPGASYIGCDQTPGKGVDRITDCAHTGLKTGSAATMLLCEMLEHCADPFAVMQEAGRLLSPAGVLVLATPFQFPLHHLPDYWRFTPEGYERLFDLAGCPFRSIFFQGALAAPHSVFGCASKAKRALTKMQKHLNATLYRVPGSRLGEMLYQWHGKTDYLQQRLAADRRRA